jgi:hypothetical protein
MTMKRLIAFLASISFLTFLSGCAGDSASSSDAGPGGVGQGGSLARFAIANNHLFAVNGSALRVFDLSDNESPVYLSEHELFTTVETIFPRDESTLFIGTTTGMFIYGIANAPDIRQISRYDHIVACDPVVANDSFAYVTLRSDQENNFCWRGVNQLDIIDITDLSRPQIVNQFPMINPKGLGLYGDTLLVCDAGLKVFDVSNPNQLKLITADEDFDAVDIIPNKDLMIVVSESGLNQYRYRKGKLNFLSRL